MASDDGCSASVLYSIALCIRAKMKELNKVCCLLSNHDTVFFCIMQIRGSTDYGMPNIDMHWRTFLPQIQVLFPGFNLWMCSQTPLALQYMYLDVFVNINSKVSRLCGIIPAKSHMAHAAGAIKLLEILYGMHGHASVLLALISRLVYVPTFHSIHWGSNCKQFIRE